MTEQPFQQPVQSVPAHVAQPQDHRSVDTFTFQSSHGPVTVPKFKKALTFGFTRKNRHLSEMEFGFALLESACDEATLDVLDQFEQDEIDRFFTEWHADSGVGVGESSAS